jgi:two-component system LytT family response regulator
MTVMQPSELFTTAIIDDEPLARKRIRHLLREHADLRIVGEAGSVSEAVELLDREHPDIVFLDAQLSDGSGFDVLSELREPFSGVAIFITAYDQHAVRAFEVHAVDYLLKPLRRERFEQMLARTREALLASTAIRQEKLSSLIQESGRSRPRRLAVTLEDERVVLLQVSDVDWVESAGNYVRLHIGEMKYLFRESMAALERKLDPEQFVRIHRSAIVNLDRVQELEPNAYGDYVLRLQNGLELSLSRRYRDRISLLLGKL